MKNMNKFVRYSIIYVAAFVVTTVIMYLLNVLLGVSANGGMSVVVPLIMGMQVGQWTFDEHGALSSSGERWIDALQFGTLGFAISVAIAVVILAIAGGGAVIGFLGIVGLLLVFVLGLVLSILATRVGIWLGNNGAAKAQAKLDGV